MQAASTSFVNGRHNYYPFVYMQISLLASFLSENSIIFALVDEDRKANLHAYKRITIRPTIYERGQYGDIYFSV